MRKRATGHGNTNFSRLKNLILTSAYILTIYTILTIAKAKIEVCKNGIRVAHQSQEKDFQNKLILNCASLRPRIDLTRNRGHTLKRTKEAYCQGNPWLC